jgi:hypothetical protein
MDAIPIFCDPSHSTCQFIFTEPAIDCVYAFLFEAANDASVLYDT